MAAPKVSMALDGSGAGVRASREQFVGSIDAAFEAQQQEIDANRDVAFELSRLIASTTAGGWDQSVANEAERLALTGLAADYRVYQLDTQRIWRWSGSAWVDTGPSLLAPISAQAARVDERSALLSGLLTSQQTIGVSGPVAGTNSSAGPECVLATAVANDGIARELRLFAGVAASVNVGVYTRSAADVFTRIRVVTVQVLPGLNVIPLDISVSRGQYLGISSLTGGYVTYNTVTNAGYFSGVLSGGSFTSATPSTTLRVEAGFVIDLAPGSQIGDVLTGHQVDQQVIGAAGALADGNNAAFGTYIMAGAALEDGVVDEVELRSRAAATVTIGLWEQRGTTMTRVEVLDRVTLAPAALNTIRIGKPIRRGQCLGYQSPTNGFVTIVSGGVGPYYRNADPAVTAFDVTTPITSAAPQIRAKITRGVLGNWHEVTLGKSDRLLAIGASYLGGYYNQRGKNWLSKVSLFSDYAFESIGLGGASYAHILNDWLRPNKVIPAAGVTIAPHEYGATWVLLMLGGNDAQSPTQGVPFEQHIEDVRQMIESVRALGAQPILSTEWQPFWDKVNPTTHVLYKQIAEQMGVPFIDMIPHTLRMRDGPFYPGFWQGGGDVNHPGVRTNHIIADEAERQLAQILPPPKSALKIFRRRAATAVAHIDDLIARDHFGRAALWREFYLNQVALAPEDEDHYDALGPGGYDQYSVQGSEYLRLRSGGAVLADDYVMIEAVIDATLPQVQRLILSLGDPDVSVWVKDAFASADPADYPADGKSVCRWVAVPGDGLGGYPLAGADLPGKLHGDRVTFLLRKGTAPWSMREPSIRWLGQSGKPARPPRQTRPARGASVLAQTQITAGLTGWTVSGSPVTSADATTQFPAGISRIVTLEPGQALAQVLDYAPDPARDREVEIVITARRNPPVFAPGGDYATAPITQTSFDWTRIYVDLIDASGTYVMTQQVKVGLWWDDLRIRSILPLRAPAMTLRLRAETDIEVAAVTARLVD